MNSPPVKAESGEAKSRFCSLMRPEALDECVCQPVAENKLICLFTPEVAY